MKQLLPLCLSFLTVCLLSSAPMLAQDTTLTITVHGTVSLVSGPDCLGANGESASASVMISESASPISSTSDSATYKIPAGGVSATVGSTTFTSTKPWSMKITLEASYDVLVLSGPGPLETTIRTTSTLKKGSWTSAVLLHPAPFQSHSPEADAGRQHAGLYRAPVLQRNHCPGSYRKHFEQHGRQ
jgi:hypothetical protein